MRASTTTTRLSGSVGTPEFVGISMFFQQRLASFVERAQGARQSRPKPIGKRSKDGGPFVFGRELHPRDAAAATHWCGQISDYCSIRFPWPATRLKDQRNFRGDLAQKKIISGNVRPDSR